MKRREFMKACAASTLAAPAAPVWAAGEARVRHYARTRLTDAGGRPLRAASIAVDRNFIFHYPFAATPCFLLNLGRTVPPARLTTAAREDYEWSGGVGPTRSIVAYSAICAHQLAYPTRDISFISYRVEKGVANRAARVIHCCAEHSQYDPARGARVVAGPAPQPLAAILLEHDPAEDALYAVGTLGGEVFEQFFDKYRFKLSLEHGGAERHAIGARSVVLELDEYCRQQVRC